MTKRSRYYFLLCIGLFLTIGSWDLNVAAQEIGKTQFLVGFSKPEKQENPDYLPPSIPELISIDLEKPTSQLPQLNYKSFSWSVYSAGLCICLIAFRLAIRKKVNNYRGGAQ